MHQSVTPSIPCGKVVKKGIDTQDAKVEIEDVNRLLASVGESQPARLCEKPIQGPPSDARVS